MSTILYSLIDFGSYPDTSFKLDNRLQYKIEVVDDKIVIIGTNVYDAVNEVIKEEADDNKALVDEYVYSSISKGTDKTIFTLNDIELAESKAKIAGIMINTFSAKIASGIEIFSITTSKECRAAIEFLVEEKVVDKAYKDAINEIMMLEDGESVPDNINSFIETSKELVNDKSVHGSVALMIFDYITNIVDAE